MTQSNFTSGPYYKWKENFMNEKHEKTKLTLRILGIVLLSLGVVFSAIGIINFFYTASTNGGVPKLFFFAFIGFPMVGVGGMLLMFSYKREIMKYGKNETMPIYKEMGKDIAPVIKEFTAQEEKITCSCGAENDKNSKFCKECGKELVKKCPDCNEKLDADSNFCKNCGHKL